MPISEKSQEKNEATSTRCQSAQQQAEETERRLGSLQRSQSQSSNEHQTKNPTAAFEPFEVCAVWHETAKEDPNELASSQ